MAKKRVYELAKDLGLSNKEMVDWLRAHEYDVKSHSSSLEDDQALAVLEKFKGEKGPKAEAPKASGSGVVLRRKRADTAAEHEHAAAVAHAPAPEPPRAAPPPPPPAPAPQPERRPEPPPVAAEAQQIAPATEPSPLPVPAPVVEAAPPAPVAAPVEVSPAPPPPTPARPEIQPVAAQAEQKPVAAQPQAPSPMPSPARPAEAQKPPPQVSNVPAGVAKVAARPAPPPPPRAPARPPAPRPTGPIVQGPGGVQSVQVTENLQMRPSATRAVVLSRPLIPIARPAPRTPSGGGFRPRPVGEVRELAVVSGGPGRGREFIDVTKDNKAGPGQRGKKGPRVEKTESISKQDLVELARQRAYVPVRGHKKKTAKKGKQTEITEMAEHKKVLRIEETITPSEMSQAMGVKSADLIRKLVAGGKMVTQNQPIDFDTASLLAIDYGWKVEKVGFEIDEFIPETEDKPEELAVPAAGGHHHGPRRPRQDLAARRHPQDARGRRARPAASPSTSAPTRWRSWVRRRRGHITFLDTPGHEAFTAMRARGANVTDIAVLVVAADDGVMPQTVEAINHAKAAKVPHRRRHQQDRQARRQPERVKQQLTEHGLHARGVGRRHHDHPGLRPHRRRASRSCSRPSCCRPKCWSSRPTRTGPAAGTMIEAKLDKGRGPVATVLVQEGTLHVGDAVVTGVALRPRPRHDERARRAGGRRAARLPRWRSSASTAPPRRATTSTWWRTSRPRRWWPSTALKKRAPRSCRRTPSSPSTTSGKGKKDEAKDPQAHRQGRRAGLGGGPAATR